MGVLEVNGVRLNLEINGTGPCLLALHGFTGNLHTWDSLVGEAEKNFTVVRADLLGHGISEAPPNPKRYSIKRCAEDLMAVVEKLNFETISLLGYSMGGRVALYFALAFPGVCSTLVLEGASPGIEDLRARQARNERDHALARRIEERGVKEFVDFWETQPLFASQSRLSQEVKDKIRQERVNSRSEGLANSLRGLGQGAQPSLWAELDQLKLPILLIVGEEDMKFRRIARFMMKLLPLGESQVVAGVGHAVHIENPATFNRIVLDFLKRAVRREEALKG